jgi:hypothetical protein
VCLTDHGNVDVPLSATFIEFTSFEFVRCILHFFYLNSSYTTRYSNTYWKQSNNIHTHHSSPTIFTILVTPKVLFWRCCVTMHICSKVAILPCLSLCHYSPYINAFNKMCCYVTVMHLPFFGFV